MPGPGVVWNTAAVDAFFRGPGGPVAQDLRRRAGQVAVAARSKVGVSQPDPLGRPMKSAPGTLRRSIVVQQIVGLGDVTFRVGSRDPIARLHHEGTRPHQIWPRTPGGRLVFYWARTSRKMVLPMVNHPGTKPNPYLTSSLPEALL